MAISLCNDSKILRYSRMFDTKGLFPLHKVSYKTDLRNVQGLDNSKFCTSSRPALWLS